jgi:hypothetical protein
MNVGAGRRSEPLGFLVERCSNAAEDVLLVGPEDDRRPRILGYVHEAQRRVQSPRKECRHVGQRLTGRRERGAENDR